MSGVVAHAGDILPSTVSGCASDVCPITKCSPASSATCQPAGSKFQPSMGLLFSKSAKYGKLPKSAAEISVGTTVGVEVGSGVAVASGVGVFVGSGVSVNVGVGVIVGVSLGVNVKV